MGKLLMILLSILLIPFISLGQDYSYGRWSYYKGYEAGFNKACECQQRFQIFDSERTYSDGYEAGYTDGRIYLNNSKKQQQSTSTYQPSNYELLYYGLQRKQQIYDTRLADLKVMMRNLSYYMEKKQIEYNNKLTQTLVEYYNNAIKTMASYSNYDLSDDHIFSQIRNNYVIWKNEINSW